MTDHTTVTAAAVSVSVTMAAPLIRTKLTENRDYKSKGAYLRGDGKWITRPHMSVSLRKSARTSGRLAIAASIG